MNIIDTAKMLAYHVHEHQKYGRHQYIVHLEEVVENIMLFTNDEELIACGYLHDVVEDTHVTIQQIYREFGDRIGNIIRLLTHKEKEDYFKHYLWLIYNSPDAKLIKLCDLLANYKHIEELPFGERRDRLAKKYTNAIYRLTFGFEDMMKKTYWYDLKGILDK